MGEYGPLIIHPLLIYANQNKTEETWVQIANSVGHALRGMNITAPCNVDNFIIAFTFLIFIIHLVLWPPTSQFYSYICIDLKISELIIIDIYAYIHT